MESVEVCIKCISVCINFFEILDVLFTNFVEYIIIFYNIFANDHDLSFVLNIKIVLILKKIKK